MEFNIPTLSALPKFTDEIDANDKPIDAEAILTDDQLERGGLVKVEAFMRTRTSAAAARKAKQREHDNSIGLRQVNIKTTEEASIALKGIAAEIGKGSTIVDAIIKTVPSVTSHTLVTLGPKLDDEKERLCALGQAVLSLSGWRQLVAKIIGIL